MIQQPPCGGRALCRWHAAVRETHASWHHRWSLNERDTSMEKNFGPHTQRDHSAHFIENLEELGRSHVIFVRILWHPELHDCFLPAIGFAAAIDRFE
jgi:hypothetical protein